MKQFHKSDERNFRLIDTKFILSYSIISEPVQDTQTNMQHFLMRFFILISEMSFEKVFF